MKTIIVAIDASSGRAAEVVYDGGGDAQQNEDLLQRVQSKGEEAFAVPRGDQILLCQARPMVSTLHCCFAEAMVFFFEKLKWKVNEKWTFPKLFEIKMN